MIPHKDRRPRQQCFLPTPSPALNPPTVNHPEARPRAQPHGPFERPGHCPLAQSAVPECSEEDSGNDAIRRAYAHAYYAREAERCEGHGACDASGQHCRQHAEEDGDGGRGGHGVEEPAHVCVCLLACGNQKKKRGGGIKVDG